MSANPYGLPQHILNLAADVITTASRLLTYCDRCLLDDHDACEGCGCCYEEDAE